MTRNIFISFEFYSFEMPERLRDLSKCVKCGEAGAKRCSKCHAVSYCSKECQVADWARHRRLCVPLVIKEMGDKGRGLVATRDFKMGDLIVKDKAVAVLSEDIDHNQFYLVAEDIFHQIEKLSKEDKVNHER